jgi:hypothetical protein
MIANTVRVSFVVRAGKIAATTSVKVGRLRTKISVATVAKPKVVPLTTDAAIRSEISVYQRA